MLEITLQSMRQRLGAFTASFLAMFLGATIVMAFASMLDTSAGAHVTGSERETLVTMAVVVGGWGALIVAFAVASTLTLSVEQRSREIALLKAVGATPLQIRRMIVVETGLLAAVAVSLAIAPAMLGGRMLLSLLQDGGQVSDDVGYGFGGLTIGLGAAIVLVAATVAALITARRTTKMTAIESLTDASTGDVRMTWKRVLPAAFFLVAGVSNAAVTATVFHGKGVDAMQTGGQASIFIAIGLALLSPVLLRAITPRVADRLERWGGVSGYLTANNVRRRRRAMASTLTPIILFVGIATGTLYMQSIENGAGFAPGATITAAEAKSVETLNFVVVGMIGVFAAVMLVNTLVAATTHRRREFAQQRLVGMTTRQVLGMVGLEGVALVATGVLLGSIASLFTVIPYSIARTSSLIPHSTIAIYLGIVVAAAILTLAASVGAARRATRTPAVEAVAA